MVRNASQYCSGSGLADNQDKLLTHPYFLHVIWPVLCIQKHPYLLEVELFFLCDAAFSAMVQVSVWKQSDNYNLGRFQNKRSRVTR